MTDLNREQKEALGRMMVEGFKKGDPAIVEGCLKRGADPDVCVRDGDSGPRRPVLHWAMANFNERAAQALLASGANIEVRDDDGETALFFAIRNTKIPAVEFLMRNGADPLAQNGGKTVALDVARGLRVDYTEAVQRRDKIIKALTKDYGPAREAPASEGPAAAPPDKTPSDDTPSAQGEIHVLKPIALQPKKGGHGFNL